LSEPTLQDVTAQFLEQTGFTLAVTVPGNASFASPQLSTPEPTVPRMEINTANWTIDEAFTDQPESDRPYKKSLKIEGERAYIELAFLTPEVGARQHELLQQIAVAIGYPLRIKPEPNQIALIALARQLIPPTWQIAKPPGVMKTDHQVRVKCLTPPAASTPEWQAIHNQFSAVTGYTLCIETSGKN
jgi:hypothetical protein